MKQTVNPTSKILLIRLSSMGDVLLATPVLRILRKVFPSARIDVAVAKNFAEVWHNNPHVNQVVEIDTGTSAFESNQVRKELLASVGKYDVVIDCQRNIRSWYLRRGLAKQTLFYEKHRAEKIAMVRNKRFPISITHIVDRYINALHPLSLSNDNGGLELWLPEERELSEYPPTHRRNIPNPYTVIAFAPGARHVTKRWLPEYFIRLAKQLHEIYNCTVLLLGGKDDIEICNVIAGECGEIVKDYSGAVSLYDTARLLDTCSVLVTNDSGVMHIAAARQISTVGIFGSTVRHFGFTPYHVKNMIVEHELPCRPCTHIGRSECPLGHFNCMKQVLPEQVYSAVKNLLQS